MQSEKCPAASILRRSLLFRTPHSEFRILGNHRSPGRRRYDSPINIKVAPGVFLYGGDQFPSPLFDLRIRYLQLELPLLDVDLNHISVLNQGEGASFGRFGAKVADRGPLGIARETAVGDDV